MAVSLAVIREGRSAALDDRTVVAGAESRLCDSLLGASGFPCLLLPESVRGARPLSYRFEDYCLDPGRRELRRGADLVPVEPLVFDLLEFLLRTRDRVVSKDDLIASVWNGRIVSESTLTSRMNAARHAVGDSGQQQRLIRTIPRKGFRFVGEVCEGERPQDAKAETASGTNPRTASTGADKQSVTFCRTQDGANIAVASIGSGSTLVRTPFLISHIEYDWQHPFIAPLTHDRLSLLARLTRPL